MKKRIIQSLKYRSLKGKRKLFASFKIIFQKYYLSNYDKPIIWIFGCQRSGTTYLENLFRQDLYSNVFGEFSELTIDKNKTVLISNEELKKSLQSKKGRYLVIRPLFESDRAIELMNLFPNSVGIWLFRDCPSVVNSMVRKWDQNFFEISKNVESDKNNFWRLENQISAITDSRISDSIEEQYAKYWVLRNSIPFEKKLIKDSRFLFIPYKTLVLNTESTMKIILRKINSNIWRGFRANSNSSRVNTLQKNEITNLLNGFCFLAKLDPI